MDPRPIKSPYSSKILASLQFQGQSNDCGPYTTATILNSVLGLNLEGNYLAREMEKPAWRGAFLVVRRIRNWATFPWGMVDVFRTYGLKASWRPFVSFETLLELLPQDIVLMPVIGAWKPLWAHVMTLVAWEPETGWGFANSQFDHHDITWLHDSIFRKQWSTFGRLLITVRKS